MTNIEKVEEEIRAKMVFGESFESLEDVYRGYKAFGKLEKAEITADEICKAREC